LIYLIVIIAYVQEILNKSKEYSKYLKSIPSEEIQNNYIPLTQIDDSTLTTKEFERNFLTFLHKIFEYNLLEIHNQDKFIFIFFLSEKRILLDKQTREFVYNISDLIETEIQIKKIIQDNKDKDKGYILIQPDLSKHVNSLDKRLSKEHKHNKFLAWSIGVLILKYIIKIPLDTLQKFYSDSLIRGGENSVYKLEDFIPDLRDKVHKLNVFFNCNTTEDDNEIFHYFFY